MRRPLILALVLASYGCTIENDALPQRPPPSEDAEVEPDNDNDTTENNVPPSDDTDENEAPPPSDVPELENTEETSDTDSTEAEDVQMYVEIDGYFAYNTAAVEQSYDSTVAGLTTYSVDGGETQIPSQVVFTFWTEEAYICHIAVGLHDSERSYDALHTSFTADGHIDEDWADEAYTGLAFRPVGVLAEWSTCDVSDTDGWDEWIQSWGYMGFGFKNTGSPENGGTKDGLISANAGNWAYMAERTGEAWELNSDGTAGAYLPEESWDFGNSMVVISDGLTMYPLE